MKWASLLENVVMQHGIWALLFIVSLVIFHRWISRLHQGRLDDRQREIDRLAKENHEYRDRFQKLIDDTMSKT